MSELMYADYFDPLTQSMMCCFKLEGCIAEVSVNDTEKWATVYSIETVPSERNRGLATELMKQLKKIFEDKGYKFGGTVALNPAMKRVYEKSGVKEYAE